MSVNETELLALSLGTVDVPVIFVSNDDKLKEQLKNYPWIKYVTVKYAQGPSSAKLRPIEMVHNEIRDAAKIALENLTKAKTIKLKIPIKAALRAIPPADLSLLKGVPGVHYHNNTVTFIAKNFRDAFNGMYTVMNVATKNYSSLLRNIVHQHENADKIMDQYRNNLFNLWLKTESKEKRY